MFGLGNSSFEFFCGMAVSTDKKLQELKAKSFFELKKGDAKSDSTEKEFNKFKESLWKVLTQQYALFEISI